MRSDSGAYVPALDGLRALAAIAVIGFHCTVPWMSGGSLGVDVFFVLSGWLITGILLREVEHGGEIRYAAFEMRRVRRLVPALALMVVVVLAVQPKLVWQCLAAVTYTMNFVRGVQGYNSPLTHTWSLATEAQFYLLWPFVISWLAVKSRAAAAQFLLGAWIAMTLARCAWVVFSGHPDIGYFFPMFRSTGLLLGAALAIRPPTWRVGWAALPTILGLFVFADLRDAVRFTFLDPIAEIATALLILDPPAALAWRPFVGIGKISYGVYLWHFPVKYAFVWLPPVQCFVTVLGLSIAFATASFFLVEKRFLVRRQPIASAALA